MAGVKPLLILAVAAFDLPIMARCVRANEFQFGLRVLVWMTVGASGLAGKGRHTSVPALLSEIDVRPALVVLPAGAVFLRILHQGLPICHVLCYTFAHEGYGPLSYSWCVVTQL